MSSIDFYYTQHSKNRKTSPSDCALNVRNLIIVQNVEFKTSWLVSWMTLLMVQLCKVARTYFLDFCLKQFTVDLFYINFGQWTTEPSQARLAR